jgi:hypothetical protein
MSSREYRSSIMTEARKVQKDNQNEGTAVRVRKELR